MKKPFLISKNEARRNESIRSVKGRKLAIYHGDTPLLGLFDVVVDFTSLMQDSYYLEHLVKCDGNTTVFLIDCMVKHGAYVHPYGRVWQFTEHAKATKVIDRYAFRYDERAIFRPFLYIDRNILGSTISEFYNEGPFKDYAENKVELYAKKVAPHIDCDIMPLEIEVVHYKPSKKERSDYDALKERLVKDMSKSKSHIVSELIKFVNGTDSRKKALASVKPEAGRIIVESNHPKGKFKLFDAIGMATDAKPVFFSSGYYGADELALKQSLGALERHNDLIRILHEQKGL